MRWPWQRDRGVPPVADPGARASHPGAGAAAGTDLAGPPVGASTGASTGSAASSTADPATGASGARESTAGWAFLPPLQRTVRPVELTSRPVAFLADLPTRAPMPFTGSMSHVVDHRAPSGVVDGDGDRAAPPVQRSADVDLALLPPAPRAAAPVQRRTGGLVALDSAPAGTPRLRAVPVDPPAPDVPTAAPASAPADALPHGDGWTADGWTAPGVTDAPAADGSWRDDAATTVPIGPPVAAPGPPVRADGPAVQRRVGLGAPISRSPLASTPPDLPLVQRDATASARGSARSAAVHRSGDGAGKGARDATTTTGDAPVQRSADPSFGGHAGHVAAPAAASAVVPDLVRPPSPGAQAGDGLADGSVRAADPAGGADGSSTGDPHARARGATASGDDGSVVDASSVQRVVGDPVPGALGARGARTAGTAPVASAPRPGDSVDGASGTPVRAAAPRTAPSSADALAVVQRRSDASAPTSGGEAGATRGTAAAPAPPAADAGTAAPGGAAVVGTGTAHGSGAAHAAGPTSDGPTGGASDARRADAPSTAGTASSTGATGDASGAVDAASSPGLLDADVPDTSDPASTSVPTLADTAPLAGGAAADDAGRTVGPGVGAVGRGASPAADLTLATPVQRSTGPASGSGPTRGTDHRVTSGDVTGARAASGTADASATGSSPGSPTTSSGPWTLPTAPSTPSAAAVTASSDALVTGRPTPDSGRQDAPVVQRATPDSGQGAAPEDVADAPGGPTGTGASSAPSPGDGRAGTDASPAPSPGDGAAGTDGSPGAPSDGGPAWTDTSPAATPGDGAAVPLDPPRASTVSDLPLVARTTAGPRAAGAGTTGTAGPGAPPTGGPGPSLSVGPLLAGRPTPVQLADRRPPTLLGGRPAARRAVPVQRAVLGVPAPSAPRTRAAGGATLTAPVLQRTVDDASTVGATVSRRTDGSTGSGPGVGADLSGDVTGPTGATPPDGAVVPGATDAPGLRTTRSTTDALGLRTTPSTTDALGLRTTPSTADALGLRPTSSEPDALGPGPVTLASASPAGAPLATLQRASAPGSSAPGPFPTTDRPLTPRSPGGAGSPVGPTVSRSTLPVRADATSAAEVVATGAAGPAGELPLVQRRVEPTPTTLPPDPPAAPPTVQRSDDAVPPPPAATPVVAPDAAGAAGPAPDGSGASPFATATPADLDELARRLMTPLMRRVRGQLLVDRERRGTRIDR